MKKRKNIILILAVILILLVIVLVYIKRDSRLKKIEREKLQVKRQFIEQFDGKVAIYDKSIIGVGKTGTLKLCNINQTNDGTHYKQIQSWSQIEKVSSFRYDVLGLTTNHNVLMYEEGKPDLKQQVEQWKNIKKVEEFEGGVVGLDYEGNVLYAMNPDYRRMMDERKNNNVIPEKFKEWKNISKLAMGVGGVVGVTEDGKVKLCTESYDFNEYTKWTDMVSADFSYLTLVGVKADGTVRIETKEQYMEKIIKEVQAWKDIIDIKLYGIDGEDMVVIGLKSDGSMVTTGEVSPKVSDLQDVLSYDLNCYNSVVLLKDGTVKNRWSDVVHDDDIHIEDGNEQLKSWKLL